MQPSKLSEFITLVRERFEDAAREGEAPVLVTSPGVRPFVRSIVERFRTQTTRAVAVGNPSARAAEDGGRDLGASCPERPDTGQIKDAGKPTLLTARSFRSSDAVDAAVTRYLCFLPCFLPAWSA